MKIAIYILIYLFLGVYIGLTDLLAFKMNRNPYNDNPPRKLNSKGEVVSYVFINAFIWPFGCVGNLKRLKMVFIMLLVCPLFIIILPQSLKKAFRTKEQIFQDILVKTCAAIIKLKSIPEYKEILEKRKEKFYYLLFSEVSIFYFYKNNHHEDDLESLYHEFYLFSKKDLTMTATDENQKESVLDEFYKQYDRVFFNTRMSVYKSCRGVSDGRASSGGYTYALAYFLKLLKQDKFLESAELDEETRKVLVGKNKELILLNDNFPDYDEVSQLVPIFAFN